MALPNPNPNNRNQQGLNALLPGAPANGLQGGPLASPVGNPMVPAPQSAQAPQGPQINAAGFVDPASMEGVNEQWAADEIDRTLNRNMGGWGFSGAGTAQGTAMAAYSQAEEADKANRAQQQATFDADLQRRIDEFYAEAERSLNPMWETRAREFEQGLIGRGIDPNSEAGQRARADFERSRTDAFNSARNQATQFGAGLQQQRWQQDFAQRQLDEQRYAALAAGAAAGTQINPLALQMQRDAEDRRRWEAQFGEDRRRFDLGFGEDTRRFDTDFDMRSLMQLMGMDQGITGFNNQMSMSELNQLLPFLNLIPQGGPSGIDVLNPYQMQQQQYQYQQGQRNQQQNAQNQTFGQILQVLPFMFSDERVKTNIRQVGILHNGLPIYAYRYTGALDDGKTHIGVMAQEVETVNPDAVIEVGGIKMVDYDKAVA